MDAMDCTVDLTNETTTGETVIQEANEVKFETEEVGKKRSIVWNHFTKLPVEKGKKPKASCNHCGTKYACDPRVNGTKSMLTHIQK